MFHTLRSFLDDHLPELIAGKSRLRASFISYNHVGRHDSGPVLTGEPELSVTVHRAERKWGASSDENASAAIRAIEEIERALELRRLEDGDNMLAVVYAGREPQFAKAIELAAKVKGECLSANVVVVTCTCDSLTKGASLVQLIEAGTLDFVVEVDHCGGMTAMNDILNGLIEAWPTRHH